MPTTFDDLLAANAAYAASFDLAGFDGIAHAGVGMVTCMDSRIDPLRMIGLGAGDAKIVRNPGGRVTEQAMRALVLGVHLLGVNRILVVPHTRCAMAGSESALQERVRRACGPDVAVPTFGAVEDQEAALRGDIERVRKHPMIPAAVAVGGFVYDVDTGRLRRIT